jgi:nucleoside-diphosphate-sugar epimerase
MSKTLVVGETSFIGKSLSNFDKVAYKHFNSVDLSAYDVVVNCALNPLYKISEYSESIDVDFEVGKKSCQNGCHYVMISTSKVYGESSNLVSYVEDDILQPYDFHSKNKAITENKLISLFSDQITILRGCNIFGFEYGRNSFMGYLMSQLMNEGMITLTIAETVKRDFLFVDDTAKIIEEVCIQKPLGIYNLSSNYPLEIGDIVKNLIDGYPYGGKVRIKSSTVERQFVLDNTKLKTKLNMNIGPFDFDQIIRNLGKQLYENK